MDKKVKYALTGLGIAAISLITFSFWKKPKEIILEQDQQEEAKILALPVVSTASVTNSAREFVERRRQRIKDKINSKKTGQGEYRVE